MSLEILVLQALKKVNPPTRQIVNGVSAGNFFVSNLGIRFSTQGLSRLGKEVPSGVVNANVPKTLLSVTGAGELNFFALTQLGNNNVKLTVKVTIDDVVVFNMTNFAQAFNGYVLPVIGIATGDAGTYSERVIYCYDKVLFSKSLLIEIIQDVTLTNEFDAFLAYKTY